MTGKALARVDPHLMPRGPMGFYDRRVLHAYTRTWARSLSPEEYAWRFGGGHGGGAADDLEATALADERAEDEHEWQEFLAGRD
ncbi:hypothetical protein [Nocardioides aequoreus]|uniref:hypothetical protein n=1 Tax=Nocardioides aequoreus TaxID=397278 RepID=UPI0004C34223|nr:hypothetical protein [Nocardioides aequoreus]